MREGTVPMTSCGGLGEVPAPFSFRVPEAPLCMKGHSRQARVPQLGPNTLASGIGNQTSRAEASPLLPLLHSLHLLCQGSCRFSHQSDPWISPSPPGSLLPSWRLCFLTPGGWGRLLESAQVKCTPLPSPAAMVAQSPACFPACVSAPALSVLMILFFLLLPPLHAPTSRGSNGAGLGWLVRLSLCNFS